MPLAFRPPPVADALAFPRQPRIANQTAATRSSLLRCCHTCTGLPTCRLVGRRPSGIAFFSLKQCVPTTMASHYRGSRGQGRQIQREHGENLAPDRLIPSLATGWDLAAGPESDSVQWTRELSAAQTPAGIVVVAARKAIQLRKPSRYRTVFYAILHFVTSDPILLLYTWMV
jgi:hypothetical protein